MSNDDIREKEDFYDSKGWDLDKVPTHSGKMVLPDGTVVRLEGRIIKGNRGDFFAGSCYIPQGQSGGSSGGSNDRRSDRNSDDRRSSRDRDDRGGRDDRSRDRGDSRDTRDTRSRSTRDDDRRPDYDDDVPF